METDKTESFVFYRSFADAIAEMDPDDQLQAFWAITRYSLDGAEPRLDNSFPRAVFTMAKPLIDANRVRRVNGKTGGRKKQEPMVPENENQWLSKTKTNGSANKKPMVSENKNQWLSETKTDGSQNEKPNENENENENEHEHEHENENGENTPKPPKGATRFAPPSLDQVRQFAWENGYRIDPEEFVNFYASKNWMVGKNKMKDWQSAVRTWDSRSKKEGKPDGSAADRERARRTADEAWGIKYDT